MAPTRQVQDSGQAAKRPSKWKKEKKKYKNNTSMTTSKFALNRFRSTESSTRSNPIKKRNEQRKKYFKVPKPVEKPLLQTKVAVPSAPDDFSANWKQISQMINKKANESVSAKSKASLTSSKATITPSTFETAEDTKMLSQIEKSKLKRKLKREKAKLGKKSKPKMKRDHAPKTTPGELNASKPEKKDLWFEVDNIYLDRVVNAGGEAVTASEEHLVKANSPSGLTPVIAIDCEMVGVGASKRSALARVSIVNQFGHCVYDKFVKPEEPVTDYRTFVSGIRPRDLVNGSHIDIVRPEVAEIFKGRIVVGHSIHNDLQALFLRHPKRDIRDTSHYFRRHFAGHVPSLKRLAETMLNLKVQSGEHSPVEDAQATMRLYTLYRKDWEAGLGNKAKKPQRPRSKTVADSTTTSVEATEAFKQ